MYINIWKAYGKNTQSSNKRFCLRWSSSFKVTSQCNSNSPGQRNLFSQCIKVPLSLQCLVLFYSNNSLERLKRFSVLFKKALHCVHRWIAWCARSTGGVTLKCDTLVEPQRRREREFVLGKEGRGGGEAIKLDIKMIQFTNTIILANALLKRLFIMQIRFPLLLFVIFYTVRNIAF